MKKGQQRRAAVPLCKRHPFCSLRRDFGLDAFYVFLCELQDADGCGQVGELEARGALPFLFVVLVAALQIYAADRLLLAALFLGLDDVLIAAYIEQLTEIGVMVYSFARVGAVVKMRVADYFPQGKRWWLRLDEKSGDQHGPGPSQCGTICRWILGFGRNRRRQERYPLPHNRPAPTAECTTYALQRSACRGEATGGGNRIAGEYLLPLLARDGFNRPI
ncbi:MAG: hypothetical protein JNK76_03690 [Planctomycetales bacterium]|nr:hypothetical protein [Planctomycetales bacterium]MBN8625559.1 hypothetical protein [Planctomycetota bacterium]